MKTYRITIKLLGKEKEVQSNVEAENTQQALNKVFDASPFKDFFEEDYDKVEISILQIATEKEYVTKTFRFYEQGNKFMIERIVFPRFIGEVTIGKQSDIENVEWIDEPTSALEVATLMRKAGDFLNNLFNKKRE